MHSGGGADSAHPVRSQRGRYTEAESDNVKMV